MPTTNFKQFITNGLWHQNPGLIQLLGLCPLLAITTTLVNGLTLGIATLVTVTLSNICVSALRYIILTEIRIPAFILIIATIVTAIELLMHAYFYAIYTTLGLFIPLIVTNCAIMARAEAYASKNSITMAMFDGLITGLGFAAILVVLGALREIVGSGTLFSNAEFLFGASGKQLTIHFSDHYHGFLLAILPTGAFIGLALLIAGKRLLDKQPRNKTTREISLSFPRKRESE